MQCGDGRWVFGKIAKWIFDTGSGVDLVAKHDVSHAGKHIETAERASVFTTANGSTKATNVCRASMPALSEEIVPYVLDDTPPVLSVGLRCKHYGYEFHWFQHRSPFLVTPDGKEYGAKSLMTFLTST